MKLERWMADRGLNDEAVGELANADRTTINRVRRGIVRPSWPLVARIKEATGGAVTADDFLES